MPVRMRLVGMRGGDHGMVVQSTADELNAERQLFLAESTRDAESRKPTQTRNTVWLATRDFARGVLFWRSAERLRGGRLACRREHVKIIEQAIDLRLKKGAHALHLKI